MNEHFQVRSTPLAEELPKDIRYYHVVKQMPQKFIEALWVFGCCVVVLINLISSGIAIRDMINSTYSPNEHWIISAVFVATLGGLLAIHKFILNGNNEYVRHHD